MVRIGINIPNELMRRLEPLKPELNISQVCREALTAKVENHERMLERLESSGTGAAIERLLEQEKEYLASVSFDWRTLGWEDAASWVKAADGDNWCDLLDQLNWHDENNWPQWEVVPPLIDGVKSFHHRERELTARMEQARQRNPDFYRLMLRRHGYIQYKAIEQEYMTAWVAYIRASLRCCQHLLEEYSEKLEKELLESWRNRREPEAPPSMLANIPQ